SDNTFSFVQQSRKGSFFVKLKQGNLTWWHAVDVSLLDPVGIDVHAKEGGNYLHLRNHTDKELAGRVEGVGFEQAVSFSAAAVTDVDLSGKILTKGTNIVHVDAAGVQMPGKRAQWDIQNKNTYHTHDHSAHYNAHEGDISEQRYLSPRTDVPTLQLPWQGIGDWCYPLIEANIDDSGLMAARKQEVVKYLDIPFLIKGTSKNVLFVSQWDNYPTVQEIPLS